jgi:antitoxin VapB
VNQERRVKLFRNGSNQAIRIPKEFELPGDEAILRVDADRLIIEAVKDGNLLSALRELGPLNEDFPDIDDFEIELKEPDLDK